MATALRARIGRRTIVINGADGGRTAAELAAACGFRRLFVDGQEVPADHRLEVAGLLEGTTLAGAPTSAGAGQQPEHPVPAGDPNGDTTRYAPSGSWQVTVVTGPDCGPPVPLLAGRHVVGRAAHAAVAIDDPRVEAHHAVVDLPHTIAAPTIARLAGGDATLDHSGIATCLSVGASRIELHRRVAQAATRIGDTGPHRPPELGPGTADAPMRPPAPSEPRATDAAGAGDAGVGGASGTPDTWPTPGPPAHAGGGSPWHRDHHRPVRPALPPPSTPIAAPILPERPARTAVPAAVLPAVLGALVTAALSIALHQPLLMLFGASAAVMAFGTWAAQHVSRARRSRSDRRAEAGALADFAAAVQRQAELDARRLHDHQPGVGTCLARIDASAPQLWERRPWHDDVWQVVVGRGEVPWRARIDPRGGDLPVAAADLVATRDRLRDVPITAQVAPGAVVGLAGPAGAGVARSMLVQLAANCGPADWRLLVVTDRPAAWDWVSWLPHDSAVVGATDAGSRDELDRGDDRHLVVVTDAPGALAARTSPLRRLMAGPLPPAVVVVAASAAALPGFCTAMLVGGQHDASGRWFADATAAELPLPVAAAGVTVRRAADAAARLAHRRDPERAAAHAAPDDVDLIGLLGGPVTADGIAARWERAGADPPPLATIGVAADGVIDVDLVRDGPHTLVGGTTGAGKSELLRTLLVSLALSSPPELLSFVLVDYKGGAAFDECATLPHVAGYVTDLDERLAARALRSLDAELRRREHLLRAAGASDLTAYRAGGTGGRALARLVVVVDEFATLAAELPGFLAALVGVAQRGRSLGVHLVLATQRPGAAIDDDIRGNTNLRIALRVQDASEALDIVGDRAPAAFPRRRAGRAMLRLGSDERVVFQVATTCGPTPAPAHTRLSVAELSAAECTGARPAPSQLQMLTRRLHEAAAGRRARPVWTPVLPAELTASELAAVTTAPAAAATVAALLDRPGHSDATDTRDVDAGATAGATAGARPVAGAPDGPEHPADPVVGVLDDPDRQRRGALRWRRADGHLLVAGALGSGTTSTAVAVLRGLAREHPPESLHLFAIDGRGDPRVASLSGLPHCGGVVTLDDGERLERTIRRVHARVRRADAGAVSAVLLIDGLPAVRSAVDALGGDLHERLDEILTDGPAAGVVAVVTTDQPLLPLSLTARCAQRWVHRLADPAGSALLDVPASLALGPDAPAGRVLALPERLEAQVVHPDDAARWTPRPGDGPIPVGVLPRRVAAGSLTAATVERGRVVLPLGVEAGTLGPTSIELAEREHVLVLGGPGSGRSTALARLALAWWTAHRGGADRSGPGRNGRARENRDRDGEARGRGDQGPAGRPDAAARRGAIGGSPTASVTVLAPRRSPLVELARREGWRLVRSAADLTTAATTPVPTAVPAVGTGGRSGRDADPVPASSGRLDGGDPVAPVAPDAPIAPTAATTHVAPALLVVDDAELIDDPTLAAWCADPARTVLAAARPDALRGAYGHWTQHVRRNRTGLVLGRPTESDGDQLGVLLPRRWPAPHAPGRGWLVVDGACRHLVQVATDFAPESPDAP